MAAGQRNSARSWKVRGIREAAERERAERAKRAEAPSRGDSKPIRVVKADPAVTGQDIVPEIFQLADGIYLGDGIEAVKLTQAHLATLRAMLRDFPA